MKKIITTIALVSAFLGLYGTIHSQESFSGRFGDYRFKNEKVSNFFVEDNMVKLNLYGDTPELSGNFTIPSDLMFRYVYTDSNSVIGKMEPIFLANKKDFDYVSGICLQAKMDCKANYKMWKASCVGTLFASILSPVASLAIAIPASQTPPRIENLGLTDVDMLQEDIYFHTYRKEAQRLKNKRIWTAYGIGLGIHVGIIFGVLTALQ